MYRCSNSSKQASKQVQETSNLTNKHDGVRAAIPADGNLLSAVVFGIVTCTAEMHGSDVTVVKTTHTVIIQYGLYRFSCTARDGRPKPGPTVTGGDWPLPVQSVYITEQNSANQCGE